MSFVFYIFIYLPVDLFYFCFCGEFEIFFKFILVAVDVLTWSPHASHAGEFQV